MSPGALSALPSNRRRGASPVRTGATRPGRTFAPPLRSPASSEGPRWGERGEKKHNARKIEPVRADAQWIVATRLLYHVHDPTGRPGRLQGI